jgi:hypothetical protein
MLRDARINTIGEGANDVLRAFLAAVGMRDVGLQLQGVLDAIKHPFGNLTRLGRFTGRKLSSLLAPPEVPVRNAELEPEAARLGKAVSAFGKNVERLLRTYQLEIIERQYQLGRVADAAMDLYASSCVLNRLDAMLRDHHLDESRQRYALATGRYFLTTADRRIRRNLRDLWDNDDAATTEVANRLLRSS